jgi:hypothetical protein
MTRSAPRRSARSVGSAGSSPQAFRETAGVGILCSAPALRAPLRGSSVSPHDDAPDPSASRGRRRGRPVSEAPAKASLSRPVSGAGCTPRSPSPLLPPAERRRRLHRGQEGLAPEGLGYTAVRSSTAKACGRRQANPYLPSQRTSTRLALKLSPERSASMRASSRTTRRHWRGPGRHPLGANG